MTNSEPNTIAFIPDFSILGHTTKDKALGVAANEDFAVTAVCLPVVQMGGMPFPSKLGSFEEIRILRSENTAPVLVKIDQVVSEFVKAGKDIYFYVNPSMEFLNVPPAHVVDIRNVGSPSACFNKKISQTVIIDAVTAAFTAIQSAANKDGVDWSRFKGLAIDITDLWGMSGSVGHIHPTCFCGECRQFFESKGLSIAAFETSPNPFQLALQSSGTGISYIDNFNHDESAESIVGKSRLREFDKEFETQSAKIDAAENLRRYMMLRHEMVQVCLEKIFSGVSAKLASSGIDLPKGADGKHILRRIVVAEGAEFSWTGGIFLDQLSSAVIDEVWFDPTEKTASIPSDVNYRYFTSSRSTYFLNAFIQLIANAKDPVLRATTGLGRLNERALRDRIEQLGLTAVGRVMDNLYNLSLSAQNESFRGFVRPTINGEIAKRLAAAAIIAPSPHVTDDDGTDGEKKRQLMELLQLMKNSSRS